MVVLDLWVLHRSFVHFELADCFLERVLVLLVVVLEGGSILVEVLQEVHADVEEPIRASA